jgi:hypothetical protein
MHELGLHAVGDAEIEMAAMGLLQEACGAEILVVRAALDIGPEFASGRRDIGFPGQIGAALHDRRREAEIETEQGRRLLRGGEQPVA